MANYCLVVYHPSDGLPQPNCYGRLPTKHSRDRGLGADEVHGAWGIILAAAFLQETLFSSAHCEEFWLPICVKCLLQHNLGTETGTEKPVRFKERIVDEKGGVLT